VKYFITYAFITLLFIACKKENALDCFKSNGQEISEARSVGDFSEIHVFDKIDVTIFKGSDYKVEVVCGKNIVKNISVKVIGGILNINNNNTCNFVRGYKRRVVVNVTVPYLSRIENLGVGTIRFDKNFSQDTLFIRTKSSGDIHLNGTYHTIKTTANSNGDIYLSGSCNSLYVYTQGANFLYAKNLQVTNYMFVETLSIGDCYVTAPNGGVFEYNIWRSGNIYYTGNPATVNNFSDGSGKGSAIKE
jgi:hypothetical protein